MCAYLHVFVCVCFSLYVAVACASVYICVRLCGGLPLFVNVCVLLNVCVCVSVGIVCACVRVCVYMCGRVC